jgi:hypothetical protein
MESCINVAEKFFQNNPEYKKDGYVFLFLSSDGKVYINDKLEIGPDATWYLNDDIESYSAWFEFKEGKMVNISNVRIFNRVLTDKEINYLKLEEAEIFSDRSSTAVYRFTKDDHEFKIKKVKKKINKLKKELKRLKKSK